MLCSLKEAEVSQLRSLMGNVAHDLKTPLFAIEADLETLKLFFNCLSDEDVRTIVAKLWQDRHRDTDSEGMLAYPILCYLMLCYVMFL